MFLVSRTPRKTGGPVSKTIGGDKITSGSVSFGHGRICDFFIGGPPRFFSPRFAGLSE